MKISIFYTAFSMLDATTTSVLSHRGHFEAKQTFPFSYSHTTFSRKQNFKKANKKLYKIKIYLSTNQLLFKV